MAMRIVTATTTIMATTMRITMATIMRTMIIPMPRTSTADACEICAHVPVPAS